ncbi:hypothetical protein [Thomasclavelia saccharogumia]|uniref:hypothetical protein n=1 Tax=Thomasclavelia saccharogumia TaxID=341225 RepID=UPI00047ABFAF|nr:hypothetical protein [Thomasclavelia saccharogumia]
MLTSKQIMNEICKRIIILSPQERVAFLKELGIEISIEQCSSLAFETDIIDLIEHLSNNSDNKII